MRLVVHKPSGLRGVILPPGDKSISHRALIFNAIASGTATLRSLAVGEDLLSTARCLQALGTEFEGEPPGPVVVHGGNGLLVEPADVLNAGNSGTSMRLLAGLLAGQPFLSVLTGDASLRSRPMDRVVKPIQAMGAQVIGRCNSKLAPLAIRGGNLHGIDYTMPVASAQVKSCILLAGLFASGETVLHQPALSRDHTERMLKAMGAQVQSDGLDLAVQPATLRATDVTVPGDISGAAFWLVAALCHPDADVTLTGVGVNPTRCGLLEALQGMGATIYQVGEALQGGEPVADLRATSSTLQGVHVGGELIPRLIDEVPVLAVAACFAQGDTLVTDAHELRVKESDRVMTTVTELSKLGASIEEREDGMVIHGTGKLHGNHVHSHGDHRLAMALAVAGMLAEGETAIEGAEAASVSYPGFWDQLQAFGALVGS